MTKKNLFKALIRTLAVLAVLIGGICSVQGQVEELNEPAGLPPKDAKPTEIKIDVDPVSDFIDEDEELNSVSQATLEDLAAKYNRSAKVFKKYAFLPKCRTNCAGGVDHLAAGTGTRNTGYGTIRFRGTRPGSTPTSAFLYWATIDTLVANPPATQVVNFNGNSVTGFLIGTGPNPCWGFGQRALYAYRAPVLPFILPGINGDYTVSGLPSNLTNGQNPWDPASTAVPLSEGASLVVLFTHPSVPANTFTQIDHPIAQLTSSSPSFGTMTFTHFLSQPIQNAALKSSRLGADGQVGGGLTNFIATTFESTSLAGPTPAPFVQIRGAGAYPLGSQDSDWNGHDGEPLNQLWDTHTMNIPNIIDPSSTTANYRVRYVANADCIVPVAHVITAR